jgi:hypothetical protein
MPCIRKSLNDPGFKQDSQPYYWSYAWFNQERLS